MNRQRNTKREAECTSVQPVAERRIVLSCYKIADLQG